MVIICAYKCIAINDLYSETSFFAATASTMLPPPAAIIAARDKQTTLSTYQYSNTLNVNSSMAGMSQSHDIDTNNTMATIESHTCHTSEVSPMNGKTHDEVTNVGNENQNGEEGGSGNSSRRESPPQNQSFQSLLVTCLCLLLVIAVLFSEEPM